MLNLARRHVLAALAVALSGLGARRAAALPAAPVPAPIEPVLKPSIVCTSRWGAHPGSAWAYHAGMGWVHANPPLRNLELAQWYGPPPPMVLPRPGDWVKAGKGEAMPLASNTWILDAQGWWRGRG